MHRLPFFFFFFVKQDILLILVPRLDYPWDMFDAKGAEKKIFIHKARSARSPASRTCADSPFNSI